MDWKKTVKNVVPKKLWFEAHGSMIHAHYWKHSDECTVVFIHGSMSNNVWWQPIASSLNKGIVLSMDLSGHGLSEWDNVYGVEKHAKEVVELIDQYAKGKIYIVGHSYGGHVAGYVATLRNCEKIILVDSPLHFRKGDRFVRNRVNVYPTIEKAVMRFKPLPRQPIVDTELLEWIGKRSLREVEGGYSWQFDPRVLSRTMTVEVVDIIKKGLKDKAVWWYGELSPFATLEAKHMAEKLGLGIEMIAGAHHAVMLDAPLILSNKIKTIIGDMK